MDNKYEPFNKSGTMLPPSPEMVDEVLGKHTKHNNSCIQKAADDEPIFVLRAQDASASQVIAYWLKLNPQISVDKHDDTIAVMHEMEDWPIKKSAD